MSDRKPFSLRIFVVDGDPEGLRLIERTNWIGKAVVFPRALLSAVKLRDEFGQTGVYMLLGPREDGEGDKIYIGEGDPVRPRLESHYAQKDFWNRAIFFVAGPGQLNKAHVQFLEAQLIRRARETKRLPMDNLNQPAEPTLSEADRADMTVFLENMLGMLPVLGVNAFERAALPPVTSRPVLYCKGKGVTASGYETTQGFTVKAGSYAAVATTTAMKQYASGLYELRQTLTEIGVLVSADGHLVFTQDYAFSSPSTAAAVILGRSANGRTEWQTSNGRTLKALQEEEASV